MSRVVECPHCEAGVMLTPWTNTDGTRSERRIECPHCDGTGMATVRDEDEPEDEHE